MLRRLLATLAVTLVVIVGIASSASAYESKGMDCHGDQVRAYAPQAYSQIGLQPVWWRPALYRWDPATNLWQLVTTPPWYQAAANHLGVFPLVASGSAWISTANNFPLGGQIFHAFTGLPPGSYAVFEWVHEGGQLRGGWQSYGMVQPSGAIMTYDSCAV